jgi:hypothetical protein
VSFGPDIDTEAEDLSPVKAKFIELWAKYPDRTPLEVADSAFRLCGLEPGFRYAQYAQSWSTDLEVLEERDARRPTARNPTNKVPDKDQLLAELLELARDPGLDAKDRVAAYTKVLEAEGHITKQVSKEEGRKAPTPPAIIFKAVNFDREPDSAEEDAA